jgi:hypothetical protein
LNSPFDEARYRVLLEGLESVEISYSQLNDELRYEAEYHRKRFLVEDKERSRYPNFLLGEIATISDGQHGYHEVDENSNIWMLTAKNAKSWFSNVEGADQIAKWVDDNNKRSSLAEHDLILSTRGTVGLCALVTKDVLPANIDQDVARIALVGKHGFQPAFVLAYLNSCFGQDYMLRNASGMVQQGLSLAKVRQIPIPLLSENFQLAITTVVQKAYNTRKNSLDLYAQAENTLLAEFGLLDWQPPEALSYERKASEAFDAGRLDAEYFSPRVQQLIAILDKDGEKIGDVTRLRKEYFSPFPHRDFQYIEISDVSSDGTASSNTVWSGEAASRATWHVHDGDIVTSMVRPIRRLSAIIKPGQNGHVCSSGFAVLKPVSIPPEVLLVYLRLPVVAQLMDLHTTASLYPAIAIPDILSLPFARPSKVTESIIVEAIHKAHGAKEEAKTLLERAKRAVEIAIEIDEAAAFNYLNGRASTITQ